MNIFFKALSVTLFTAITMFVIMFGCTNPLNTDIDSDQSNLNFQPNNGEARFVIDPICKANCEHDPGEYNTVDGCISNCLDLPTPAATTTGTETECDKTKGEEKKPDGSCGCPDGFRTPPRGGACIEIEPNDTPIAIATVCPEGTFSDGGNDCIQNQAAAIPEVNHDQACVNNCNAIPELDDRRECINGCPPPVPTAAATEAPVIIVAPTAAETPTTAPTTEAPTATETQAPASNEEYGISWVQVQNDSGCGWSKCHNDGSGCEWQSHQCTTPNCACGDHP